MDLKSLHRTLRLYISLMKFGTVIPYLKKIQETHKSRGKPLEFC